MSGVNCPEVKCPESIVLESNVRSQLSWSQISGVNCPGVNCPESNVLESNIQSQISWSQMSGSREKFSLLLHTIKETPKSISILLVYSKIPYNMVLFALMIFFQAAQGGGKVNIF